MFLSTKNKFVITMATVAMSFSVMAGGALNVKAESKIQPRGDLMSASEDVLNGTSVPVLTRNDAKLAKIDRFSELKESIFVCPFLKNTDENSKVIVTLIEKEAKKSSKSSAKKAKETTDEEVYTVTSTAPVHVNTAASDTDTSNTASTTADKGLYRVRISWEDEKSQVGAYSILDNAKAGCPAGFSVFDENGNCLYTAEGTVEDLSVDSMDENLSVSDVADLAENAGDIATEEAQATDTYVAATPSQGTYLGNFKLTFYCPCSICCGSWANGITASGAYAQPNHTIAVDRNVIPLGTHVIINGQEYVAEDTGGAIVGNRIDVYMDSHQACLNAGVQYADVYLAQ